MAVPESQLEYLLDDLCIELGFCLSPTMKSRLAKFPPKTANRFADAVIRADGLNPETIEKDLYAKVFSKVEKIFKKHESASN